MSTVYFIPSSHHESEGEITSKLDALWERAALGAVFSRGDLTAVKLHVGEPGTTTFVAPRVITPLVAQIARRGAHPFLTDTAVLYKSPRNNGVGHTRVAHEHGFSLPTVGAPFIPADGLDGRDASEIPVNGRHFSSVSIASAILHARSMLVVSHATGHLGTGLGATLKNLGMGCSSRMGKLRQHHGQQPHIDEASCLGCAVCAEWCPEQAISVDDRAAIDSRRCIGCGECIAACREDAVSFDWGIAGRELQERVVEHAAAVARHLAGKVVYLTVAQQMTKNCDCLGLDEAPIVDDLGFLASFDPVAIDRAVLDLVRDRDGSSLAQLAYPRHDATVQLQYAEAMGIGENRAEIVRV